MVGGGGTYLLAGCYLLRPPSGQLSVGSVTISIQEVTTRNGSEEGPCSSMSWCLNGGKTNDEISNKDRCAREQPDICEAGGADTLPIRLRSRCGSTTMGSLQAAHGPSSRWYAPPCFNRFFCPFCLSALQSMLTLALLPTHPPKAS